MKKIIIDARELSGRAHTGGAKFLRQIVSGLAASKHYEVFLAPGRRSGGFIPATSAGIIERKEFIRPFYDQITLWRAAAAVRADFFYSPYVKVPVFFKGALISSFFDITYLYPFSGVTPAARTLYEKFLLKIYSAASSAVITLSRHSAEELKSRLRVPSEKIKIINPGVDALFRPPSSDDKESVRAEYRLPTEYILYLGNAKPHKNVRALERAHAILPSEIRERYPLVLAGAGEKYKPLSGKTLLVPRPPEKHLPALYGAASLFVFPSLSEGFGLPPLEAMACGCPVASSRASCMPEILGDACVYFDPYSDESIAGTIAETLADAELGKRLAAGGLRRAAMYDPSGVSVKFEAVLEEIG